MTNDSNTTNGADKPESFEDLVQRIKNKILAEAPSLTELLEHIRHSEIPLFSDFEFLPPLAPERQGQGHGCGGTTGTTFYVTTTTNATKEEGSAEAAPDTEEKADIQLREVMVIDRNENTHAFKNASGWVIENPDNVNTFTKIFDGSGAVVAEFQDTIGVFFSECRK